MAYIKSMSNQKKKIRTIAAMQKVINYAANPEKAELITTADGSRDLDLLKLQFEQTQIFSKRRGYNGSKKEEIIAHHYVQSFLPEENVTPELAHKICCELMEKAAPNYQYIIATHVDKQHTHNHIVINSVNPVTGYKWKDNKATLAHMRNVSDELCAKYNLSIIPKSNSSGLNQETYQLAAKGKSWKVKLCTDLDEAVNVCRSKNDFIGYMEKLGYSVKYSDVHITLTPPNEEKKIRVNTLAKQFGQRYTKQNLENAMGFNTAVSQEFKEQREIYLQQKQQRRKNNSVVFVTEWQRYEQWYFAQSKPPATFLNRETAASARKIVSYEKQQRNLRFTSIEALLLKILLYILINNSRRKIKKKLLTLPKWITGKNYPYKKVEIDKTKKSVPIRKIGNRNISFSRLSAADGNNYFVTVNPTELLRIAAADDFFFFVSIKNQNAQVMIKEYNKCKVAQLLGKDVGELDKENEKIKNSRIYRSLKKEAEEKNVKLKFLVLDNNTVEKIKDAGIRCAIFSKEEKFNTAFLPEDYNKAAGLIYNNQQKMNRSN